MVSRQQQTDNTYNKMEESIKRELIATLLNKGVSISKVQINMKSGNLNVEVQIDEK